MAGWVNRSYLLFWADFEGVRVLGAVWFGRKPQLQSISALVKLDLRRRVQQRHFAHLEVVVGSQRLNRQSTVLRPTQRDRVERSVLRRESNILRRKCGALRV